MPRNRSVSPRARYVDALDEWSAGYRPLPTCCPCSAAGRRCELVAGHPGSCSATAWRRPGRRPVWIVHWVDTHGRACLLQVRRSSAPTPADALAVLYAAFPRRVRAVDEVVAADV